MAKKDRLLGRIALAVLISALLMFVYFNVILMPDIEQAAVALLSEDQAFGIPDLMLFASPQEYLEVLNLLSNSALRVEYHRLRLLDWIFPLLYAGGLALAMRKSRWFMLALSAGFFDYLENTLFVISEQTLRAGGTGATKTLFAILPALTFLKYFTLLIAAAIGLGMLIARFVRRRAVA